MSILSTHEPFGLLDTTYGGINIDSFETLEELAEAVINRAISRASSKEKEGGMIQRLRDHLDALEREMILDSETLTDKETQ